LATGKTKAPPTTLEEPQYLRELIAARRPVRVKTTTNDEFEGVIEYYDARFIRLTRQGAPNLFLFKHDLKYVVEEPIPAE
jgi:host factor-I protein